MNPVKERTYGEFVKDERKKRGWSQSDLGKAAGLSIQTVFFIESDNTPSPRSIQRIDKAFKENSAIVPDDVRMESVAYGSGE